MYDKKKNAIRKNSIAKTQNPAKADEIIDLKRKAKNKCFYCKKKCKLTLDHIIPLARGGTHSIDNIVFACLSCNCSKKSTMPNDYAKKIGMLII